MGISTKYIETIIGRSFTEIRSSSEPWLTLTEVVYNMISNKILNKIISVKFDGNIAVLSDIQINTTLDFYDYFLFKKFKTINPIIKTEINLTKELYEALLRERQYRNNSIICPLI